MTFRIKDTVWIQNSFLLPADALDKADKQRRVLTSAAFKYTDTTIGGNFAINAPPQFTRFADIRLGGNEKYARGSSTTIGEGSRGAGGIRWMMSTGQFLTQDDNPNSRYTSPSAGMGRFYSESLDDYGQDLVMRFGVPEYNSLMQFFGNFYSTELSSMARTGRTNELFATAGRAAGFLLALPLQPLILGGQIIRFLGNWPTSKYYYLKPTMYPYWNAVNTIANSIAVNLGLTPMGLTEAQTKITGQDSIGATGQQQVLESYAQVLPDVFLQADGKAAGLDVYKIAGRAQRLANVYNTTLTERVDSLTHAGQISQAIANFRDEMFTRNTNWLGTSKTPGIDDYRKVYLGNGRNDPNKISDGRNMNLDGTTITPTPMATGGAGGEGTTAPSAGVGEAIASFTAKPSQIDVDSANKDGTRPWYNYGGDAWEMFQAERRDGTQFVTFRVQHSGTADESFSNSIEESQIAQKFNSTSSSARQARFNLADGKLANIPLVGEFAGQVLDAAKSFAANALEGIQMSGLLALAGNSFVDIPKTWSGSTSSMNKASYTIQLRSPYGSRMSRMMNLYIPMSMLLAAALPLSTGKRSYTAPFICEAFCRGRHAIRLGMVESMSITRGQGNLGWNQDGDALGIDISFTIADLSSILHLPIQANFGFTDKVMQGLGDAAGGALGAITGGAAGSSLGGQELASYFQKGTYDDDNSFTDYMAVLGSLSWQDMTYSNRRWRLARYRQMQNWTSWKSPARVSAWAGTTMLGRIINVFSAETDRAD